jgi:hypothetical protein
MTELGAEIGGFRTDNRERLHVALLCLVVGGAASLLGWVWFTTVPGIAAGALLGLAAIGLVFGIVLLAAVFRHRGERFTLYELGVVRVLGRHRTELRWADITAVRIVEAVAHPVCLLKLRTGGQVRFAAATPEAQSLADWIRAAVEDGSTPRRC